jgi:hypothetical protein
VLSKSETFTGSAATTVDVRGGRDVRLPTFDIGAPANLAVYVTLHVAATSRLLPAYTQGAATADFATATGSTGTKPSAKPSAKTTPGGVSYQGITVGVTGTTTTTTTAPPSRCTQPQMTPTGEAQTTLVQYFGAIDTGDTATAYGLLGSQLQAGWTAAGPTSDGAANFASFMAQHVECARVTSITTASAPGDPDVSASLGIQWYRVELEARYKEPFPAGSGEFPIYYKVHADPHTGAGRPPNEILDIATGLGGEGTTTTVPSTTTTTRPATSTSTTTTSTSTTTTSTTTPPTTTRALTGPTAVVTLGDSFISGEAGRWEGNALNPLLSRAGTDRAFAYTTETHVKQVTEAVQSWSGIFGWFTQLVTKLVTETVVVPTYDPARVYGASAASGCHRSDVAEVNADIPGIQEHVNLACSGAVAAQIYRPGHGFVSDKDQASQAVKLVDTARSNQVRLIELSIGGNDLTFSTIVTDCVWAYLESSAAAPDHCAGNWTSFVNDQLNMTNPDPDSTVNKVRKAIDEIRAAMETPVAQGGAGYAPSQYRIVLQSYPSPIPRGSEFGYPEAIPLDVSVPFGLAGFLVSNGRATLGCPFWDSDATWARDTLVPQLSDTLRAIAVEKGVGFLDLSDFLQNREICSVHDRSELFLGPPSSSASEWARAIYVTAQQGIAQGDANEAIHPNAYAQRGLQRCLTSVYEHVWNEGQSTVHLKCVNNPGGPENVTTQVVP